MGAADEGLIRYIEAQAVTPMKPLNSDKGKQPVRAHSSGGEGLTTSGHPYNGNGYQYGDARRPTTSDGLATSTPPPNVRSKFRGSLLVAASDALGFSFGRRRPPVRQVPAPVVLSDVIEISAARPDAEDEERDRLRKLAAEAIGLDPNMPSPDSHSQSRASASATDTEEEEDDDAGRRQRYAQFAPGGGRRSPHGSSRSVTVPPHIAAQPKSPARGRFRAGSLATGHSPSNSMTIVPIPAFPTTVAALASFREAAGVHPKYYPPSSLRIFALSRNWKSRFLLLSSPATLVTRGRTPAVSYLHLFKSAGADEKELERLEINEDSVVFVSEEEVGGRRHVIKVGGADVGAMRKEYTHEEGGHIMWLLQIADPAEAQRWISNIKHAILGQRTVRAGLIPPLSLGNNEPRGDMDVMMSIRTQTLASAISPTSTTFKKSASPPPDAYASSVSSHSVRSQGVPASPTSAVSALKGLFSGARPRAASRATSISSDRTMDRDDESFAKRGSNLLSMLRAGTPDTQSVHTVQSARTLPAPTAPLPFAGPIALERRIERRTIQDPARPLGAWVSAIAEQSSSTAGKERDRSSKGLSLSAMSLQPPPRKRWAASGASDAGTTTPTGRPESARRVSFSAEREHNGGGGEADSLAGFQFGTPEQRPRAPSLQSVSTLASGEPPLSSSSTTRSSRASARRWSRQGLLPTRTLPPSDPPPAVPHPYATPESTGGSPGSGGKSVVSGLPTFSKRASGGSVNSFNTMYSHTPSVGSSPRAAPVPHRTSIQMPPPRPAPTSALPPAPMATPAEAPAEPPEEASGAAKASLRTAVAHRTFRLSMGAPKPPPSGTLPPRPDEPTHGPPPVQAHRRMSSSGGGVPPTTLTPIPASPIPPAKLINPFPPPVGPLPPTPVEPPSPPPAPTKRTASFKQRLRNLSNPPPVSTPPPTRARSHTSVAHLTYAPSPPPTPIAEKITLFQNDPSFLQMQTPVPAAAPVPAAIAAFEPMPDDQLEGMVSLLPPPRRGSKQLLESELERPPRTPEPAPDAQHVLTNRLSIVAEPPLLSHLSLSRPGSAMSRRSHRSDTFLEIDWESPKDDTPPDDYLPDKHPSPTEPHHISLSRPGSVVSLGMVMAL